MGAVFKDNRGERPVWGIRFKDVDGQIRKERTHVATKTLARRILAEREHAVEQARLQHLDSVDAILRPGPPLSLRKFSEEYLVHVRARCASNTARTYELLLNKYILPKLGDQLLRRINTGAIQKYSDARMSQSAPATVMQELQILSGLYREAMRRELVDKNPVSLVRKPRLENTIVRYLDPDEEKRLLEKAYEPLRSAILVAIHSGLREEEEAALEWVDVRAAEGILVVRNTKSKRDRVVPMNATLKATLEAVPRHSKSPYVFTNMQSGTRYDRFNNRTWRSLLVRAKVNSFRWHDLRHTFGSRLAQAGRSILEIRELMGHSDVTVTMRYAHLAPNNLREAVFALDRKSTHNGTHATSPIMAEVVSH
jgi:integrase